MREPTLNVRRRQSLRARPYPVAVAAIALCLSASIPGSAQDLESALATSVDVFVPESHNLQWMNFWVALGGDLFVEEGLNVKTVLPAQPDEENASGALRALFAGSADIAVLPRPIFLTAVARGRPVLA